MHFGCFNLLILSISCIKLCASAPSILSQKDNDGVLFSEGGSVVTNLKPSKEVQEPVAATNVSQALPPSTSMQTISNNKSSSSSSSVATSDVKNNPVASIVTTNNTISIESEVKQPYSDQPARKTANSLLSTKNDHEGDGDSRSVKKDLNHIDELPQPGDELLGTEQEHEQAAKSSQPNSQTNVKVPNREVDNINGFTETAGVIFVLSLLVIAFIMYRTCK